MTSNAPPGPGAPDVPPKGRLHVDADWKREAQAEKERLARELEGQAAPAGEPREAPGGAPPVGLPPATFETLVQTLATQAAIFLSDEVDPRTGRPLRHLGLAKHHIDLLRVVDEKTRGNLTPDEKHLLDGLMHELLLAYVEAAS